MKLILTSTQQKMYIGEAFQELKENIIVNQT